MITNFKIFENNKIPLYNKGDFVRVLTFSHYTGEIVNVIYDEDVWSYDVKGNYLYDIKDSGGFVHTRVNVEKIYCGASSINDLEKVLDEKIQKTKNLIRRLKYNLNKFLEPEKILKIKGWDRKILKYIRVGITMTNDYEISISIADNIYKTIYPLKIEVYRDVVDELDIHNIWQGQSQILTFEQGEKLLNEIKNTFTKRYEKKLIDRESKKYNL